MQLHLGPFQGITDVWFRKAYQQYFTGLDKLYTPFFGGIHSLNSKHFKSDELSPLLNDVDIVVPQLLTNNAIELERFAQQCHGLGYSELNINMGCPWPQVTSKKRGCGLMPYPVMVESLLSVVKDLPVKVSVKCRLGMNDVSELSALLPIYEKTGVSELIIHARTGKQLYKGNAQPDALAPLIANCAIPIVYNGDIFESTDCGRFGNKLPRIAGLMLGRGLLADPFLAADIKGLASQFDNKKRAEVVKKFITTLTEQRLKGRRQVNTVPGPTKELWWYLSSSFDQPVRVWRQIRKAALLEEFLDDQAEVFSQYEWIGSGFARKFLQNEEGFSLD
jgi:tRNA-dihydrouridine synthase